MNSKKVVYFMCENKEFDGHVSHLVWDALKEKNLSVADFKFQGKEVYKYVDNNEFYFVPTKLPICYMYSECLEEMNDLFGDFDFSGMVTWHEGASAPSNVLTVHSIGDVNTGVYGKQVPKYMHNLIVAYEKNRIRYNLDEYSVVTEATHWSGCYNEPEKAKLITEFKVPIVDIEVGSDLSSWDNPICSKCLADTLFNVFDEDNLIIHNILCVGGMHFDPDFAIAAKTVWNGNETFGVTHIIANQWLVSGDYTLDRGIEFMDNAIKAIDGKIEAITFHDNTKGCYKDVIRTLGEKYNIPVFKHQKLRKPEEIEWNK